MKTAFPPRLNQSKPAIQRIIAIAICCLLTATAISIAEETLVEPLPPKTVDLLGIPRDIVKEPTYQTKSPGYCLLVFGLEAKTRVWLVIDGESAYIDYNGNGDLTEEGERVDAREESRAKGRFDLGDVTELDGKTTHQDLTFLMHDNQQFQLLVETADGHDRTVGISYDYDVVKPRMAASPANAPIIHPNGPIAFARYGPINFRHVNRAEGLVLGCGWWSEAQVWDRGRSPSLEDCACVGCDGDRQLTAEIEFPAKSADAPPIISKQALMTEG